MKCCRGNRTRDVQVTSRGEKIERGMSRSLVKGKKESVAEGNQTRSN